MRDYIARLYIQMHLLIKGSLPYEFTIVVKLNKGIHTVISYPDSNGQTP